MINNDVLSDPEIRRFGNQIALPQIGIEGQVKLKRARVCVVGAGGLGSVVLQHLAATGVGYVGIIDYSLVEETDIQRQTLYGGNDMGKLKTIISKQHLQNLFPLIDFEIINLKLTQDNADRIVQPFDMVIDATNDGNSHQVIGNACKSLGMTWIFGSIQDFTGEVAVIDRNCHVNYDILKQNFNNGSEHQSKGTLALAYCFIGTLMALEALKSLVGNSESLANKILSVNLLSYQFNVKSFI